MRKISVVAFVASLVAVAASGGVAPPEEFLGHPVGADRQLAPYPKVLEYLELVAAASDRVSIEEAGTSTEGHRMPIVVLTSAANHERLERFRDIARDLARPKGSPAGEVERLVDEGKVIALVTCTIHSTEVGCTQMATEFVYEFATTDDAERTAWMEEAIVLLMPSINPDGQYLVIDWYERWVGTDYEGGRMPWLYQTYVGHDNNRDFYMLTQEETRVVNDVLYHRWFPQVFLDEHQMGSTGPRMFVPPQTDPLAPEVHSLIFRQADLLGTNMARRLEEAGKRGVGHNMIYDSYWPGGTRNTAWWKNVTGLLTEVASVRIATPIHIEPGELEGGRKGFPEYGRRANYPSPWSGGWWRLRDIVEYEKIATWAFLESCAENRADILRNTYRMASEAIERGRTEPPYAFVIPSEQHDPVAAAKLVELLDRHAVELRRAVEPIEVGRARYPAGTVVVPAAQAYRPFLLTMLRPQRYPEVLPYPGGPVIPPYDVTSWSLPISMGVDVVEATEPIDGELAALESSPWPPGEVPPSETGWTVSHGADTVYTLMNRVLAQDGRITWMDDGDVWLPPGSVPRSRLDEWSSELHLPLHATSEEAPAPRWQVTSQRIGLYKPWVASMDEGWTRFVLERYEFPFVNLANEQIRSGEFTDSVDLLLFPDVEPEIIATGEPAEDSPRHVTWSPLPPPYSGGIDRRPKDTEEARDRADTDEEADDDPKRLGGEHIRRWVREDGGTVVALDSSTAYVIDLFELPIEDVLAEVEEGEFVCPGSMLRLLVDTSHPLGFGMREEDAGYFASSPAFRTHLPDARFDRRVVARYPDDEEDLLISGYLEGGELLERRAAVVDYRVGEGRVVLIGFRAQHRAQPLRTFKLLFNALYEVEEVRSLTDGRKRAP